MLKLSDAETKRAQEIIESMTPLSGMVRTANKCGDCGSLFGRQFIPYGLGRGLSVDLCGCQLTASRPFTAVLESKP